MSFDDFPPTPQVEPGLPADIGAIFEGSVGAASGGPCLAEPSLEALVPSNWTPLRFEWTPPANHNVIELRISAGNQNNALVVYTSQPSFTIDAAMWQQVRTHSAGQDVQVRVRSAQVEAGAIVEGPFVGADGVLHLAPVPAPGGIVYWANPGASGYLALNGFMVGDEQAKTVIAPPTSEAGVCVGCHTSSPDGSLVFLARDPALGSDSRGVAALAADGTGALPTPQQVSAVARELLQRPVQSAPALSEGHSSANDAVALSVFYDATLTAGRGELAWTDLHATDPATGWGLLSRNGDPRQVTSPTWWHDGSRIAYTSAPGSISGAVSSVAGAETVMDIYSVPYNNRAGGDAEPVVGASDPNYLEFYPSISPLDTLLAFNRIPLGSGETSYDQPAAEVMVVPSKGGTPVRIEGNDAPACSNRPSPGITNSWPRWSPSAGEHGGKRYYWLTFSSRRRPYSADPANPPAYNPQLFVAGVVTVMVNGVETIERAYPALYVTSQKPEADNHTPAWGPLQL